MPPEEETWAPNSTEATIPADPGNTVASLHLQGRLGPLSEREYRRFFFASTFSSFGDRVGVLVLVKHLGGAGAWATVLTPSGVGAVIGGLFRAAIAPAAPALGVGRARGSDGARARRARSPRPDRGPLRPSPSSRSVRAMSVRVRMAPSPTGFLHIGNVRTALFNWLFARHEGGEFLLRIENTDTAREVYEATEQIQESLRWLGLDWDGPVTFQLDNMNRCRELAHELVAADKAYEDDGAIRFRMPDEGMTAWEDVVLGHVEVQNKDIEDVVILRSDGRPTYNFASPVEDVQDRITHVLRGPDHVSNTPKQIQILQALGAELPVYGHVPNVNGEDGKKLSKRHGAVTVDEFRKAGYYAPALVNHLALLGWSYDDKTTIMSVDELVERFSLDRISRSPATFDYDKLDHINGMHLRALPLDEYADALVLWLGEQGHDWDAVRVRETAPLVQEKIAKFSEYPDFVRFLFEDVEVPALGNGVLAEATEALAATEPFTREQIEAALREWAEREGLKPREAFQPVRIAVTGSKISPGLFESLELLGKEKSLERLRVASGNAS
jgi:glutamyl/glutaminyl-tRNA synthetase